MRPTAPKATAATAPSATLTQFTRSAIAALVIGALIAPQASAQDSERPKTLVERLSSLRFGWNRSSEEPAPEPRSSTARSSSGESRTTQSGRTTHPGRTVQSGRTVSRSRTGTSAMQPPTPTAPRPPAEEDPESRTAAEAIRSRLPQLNPRDLLPDNLDFFRRSAEAPAPPAQPTASRPSHEAISGVGSARARIMRDLRQRANEPTLSTQRPSQNTPPVAAGESKTPAPSALAEAPSTKPEPTPTPLARRAPARAGSVLSPPSGVATRPSPMESDRVEMDADKLREELLGPSYAAKPHATSQNKSPAAVAAKRELSKSLAADIAREMAAEPEAKKAVGRVAVTEAEAPAKEEPSEETRVAESHPGAETEKENSLDAFAAGLAGGGGVGGRYSTSEPIPAPAARATPAAPVVLESAKVSLTPKPKAEPLATPKREPVAPKQEVAAAEPAAEEVDEVEDFATNVAVIDEQTPVLRFDGVTREEAAPASSLPTMSRDSATLPRVVDATAAPLSASEAELLMSKKMPLIASRVDGPRRIVIGRKAEYKVVLANRGEAAADDLVARVKVPDWADVVSTDASKGEVHTAGVSVEDLGVGGKVLEWRLDRFDAKSLAQLSLALVAREGKPIELGVDWRHAPVGSKTVVEVQEPKLQLAVKGPSEVLFGVPQRYQLTLSNPGTGTAEGVTIHLQPPGRDTSDATTHTIGPIGAGVSKTAEIELTAREPGELAILAKATAGGGLETTVEKKLFCRKAELNVDWRGPKKKYSGAVANYYFRVRNPGTAAAEDVMFVVDLPPGFELNATSPGQKYSAAKRRLAWNIGSLRPGDDKYLQIRGMAKQAGDNQFRFAAATGDRLIGDNATASTQVVAVADLRLDVLDPKGPLPVGAEVVYEVRVKNRGASAASGVDIVAMFSQGIEPYSVEGAHYTVSDGRVAMETIGLLAAGDERVVRIKAKADQAGTHLFRAEVVCNELEIKLAEEEVTRFYAEESINLDDSMQNARSMDEFIYPR